MVIGKIPSKRKDGRSSFRDLVAYCTTKKPADVAHIGHRHILFPEIAATEMEAVATENPRCKDPVFHAILSWREHELPTNAQIDEAVRIYLEELNLEDCQALWVFQRDTQNQHVHIIANRVHPETSRAVSPANGWTYKATEMAARKIEVKQGWEVEQSGIFYVTEDGQILEKEKSNKRSISQTARDAEVHYATKSAERIAQETAAPIMRETQNWQQLHECLAAQGISFEKKGSGAILWIGGTAVKASRAGRDISLSKLTERLGAYVPRPENLAIAERRPEPIEQVVKAKVKLDWERYQDARKQYYADKSDAYAAMQGRHKKQRVELREMQKAERALAFAGSWKGRGALLNNQRSIMAAKQKGEQLDLADIQKKELEIFRRQFPRRFMNFKTWLEDVQEERTPILDYRYANQGAILANGNGNATPVQADLRQFKPRIGGKGGVAYVADGGQTAGFIDYGKKIVLAKKSGDAEILAALQLANQKWGAADIQGSEAYKQKCVEIAASHNLRISNPDLAAEVEKKRKEREQPQAAAKPNVAMSGTDTFGTSQARNTSSASNGSDVAYWTHCRDIVSKLQESPDCSRIDAMIGVRMRVTGHSQDEIRSAIERNALAMRRETMSTEACEAKYRERDWSRYAAETTENFVFGPRGAILHGMAQGNLPLYLRLEGRSMAEMQQEAQRRYQGR